MNDWQPIETAPLKIDVLVYGKMWTAFHPFNPVDESGFEEFAIHLARRIYEDLNNAFYKEASNYDGCADVLATHWMPLPAPPQQG